MVHLASPVALGAWGTRVARAEHLPTVAVYQTDLPSYARAYHLGRATEAFAWRWLRDIHNAAGRTLAPSSMTAADLDAHGLERVWLWGRGVDTERFHPGLRDERLRAEIAPGGEVIVGYVGRLAIEKRVDLLAAVAALPGVKLAVTGGGPMEEELRAALPSAAFLGMRLRRGAGADLRLASTSSCTPARSRRSGRRSRRPSASGLPVVAPASGGPLDLVDDGGTGYLIPPGDPGRARGGGARARRRPGAARPVRRGGAAAGARPDLVRAYRRASRPLRGRHQRGRAARPAGGLTVTDSLPGR